MVGYGPVPDGVVDRLRSVGAIGVRGNHDAAAVGGSEIDWFNPDARRAMEWTRSPSHRQPRTGWTRFQIVARSTASISSMGAARTDLGVRDLEGHRAGQPRHPRVADRLHGHTHVPVAWIDDGGGVELSRPGREGILELAGRRALVNPGSVGQPRDGDPAAAYLILDPETGAIHWHRVAYDIAAVQDAMRAAGLPASLRARLSVGL